MDVSNQDWHWEEGLLKRRQNQIISTEVIPHCLDFDCLWPHLRAFTLHDGTFFAAVREIKTREISEKV